jgi:cellulose synthase/poly-beta-1,6-N-acetylglucosamine synthase-like glycosyltransferase
MRLPTAEPASTSRSSTYHEKQRPLSARLINAAARLDNFINAWTPLMLVASYFIFSTCFYMICSPELITTFWFIYLITNFYIAGSTVIEAIMSMSPNREAREALEKVKENKWIFPTPDEELLILDLVIVAYLPNEKDIIMDRINYAIKEIVYPRDKIRVNLFYNTPRPIEPLETKLRQLAAEVPHLHIHKVLNSSSKADNLNYFFTLNTGSDIIAVFDCDHYPQPYGPRWAAEKLISDKVCQIVQGRCVIFNTKTSWLSAMIGVEFDKIYAVSHPGRAATWDFGLFTGSNGYWRSTLLKDLKMDDEMLTEDIDSSLRAFSRGCKIAHDPNVVSYELAPTTTKAFWNQRLRWAQGWAQASVKHTKLAFLKSDQKLRSKTQRFGLISLLLIRELSYYLVTQYCCLVLSIIITSFPKSGDLLVRFLFFQYPVAYWLFILRYVFIVCTFYASLTNELTTAAYACLQRWSSPITQNQNLYLAG